MRNGDAVASAREGLLSRSLASFFRDAPAVLVPLLVMTLPLEVTQTFTPVAIIQVSRLVIALCLVTLLIQRAFRLRDVRLPPLRISLPIVCLIGYAALSAALSGSLLGLKTVAAMVAYSLMALVLYNWCGTLTDQNRFWTWLAVSVIALSIVGLVEATTGTFIWNAPNAGFARVNATFKDPNVYARFLTVGVVTAVVLASRPFARSRALFGISIVLASAALPFTFSRQGWVVGALVLLVAVAFAMDRKRALLLATLAVGSFAAVGFLDPQVRSRWNNLGEILTTLPPHVFNSPLLAFINYLPLDSARRYLVAAGFQMFYDHPLFGVGFGNFPANMLGHYSDFVSPTFKTIDSHTSFVTLIAELGIVGLALASWWAFELVRFTAKSLTSQIRRPYVMAAGMALLLIVFATQFEGRLFEAPYAWLFMGVALAAQRIEHASDRRLRGDPGSARTGMARIAMVHDIAGVARVQAQILRGAGYDVDMITLPLVGASWKWPSKAITIPFRLAMYLPAILKLRNDRYDVIHIHWLSQGVVGLLIGRQFFAQAHGSDLHVNLGNPVLRRLTSWVVKKATAVFYVTPNLPAYVPGFEHKLCYLPNPVRVEEAAEPPPSRLRTAFIFTRIEEVKGVDRIFPAAERLRRSVELTALDWGPLSSEYMERYGSTVRFVRPLPHDEIPALLARFDVIIGQMHQGILSLSELEAMAVGRPVITGIDWSLYPDDPPPVIAADNADDIAGAVERLKDDQAELARLSREGRDWVRRNHGYERHLQLLEIAYFGTEGS